MVEEAEVSFLFSSFFVFWPLCLSLAGPFHFPLEEGRHFCRRHFEHHLAHVFEYFQTRDTKLFLAVEEGPVHNLGLLRRLKSPKIVVHWSFLWILAFSFSSLDLKAWEIESSPCLILSASGAFHRLLPASLFLTIGCLRNGQASKQSQII